MTGKRRSGQGYSKEEQFKRLLDIEPLRLLCKNKLKSFSTDEVGKRRIGQSRVTCYHSM